MDYRREPILPAFKRDCPLNYQIPDDPALYWYRHRYSPTGRGVNCVPPLSVPPIVRMTLPGEMKLGGWPTRGEWQQEDAEGGRVARGQEEN